MARTETQARGKGFNSVRELWLLGLGALATMQEERHRLIHSLRSKGEEIEAHGNKTVTHKVQQLKISLTTRQQNLQDNLITGVSNTLHHIGIVNKADIQQLSQKVDRLNIHIETLNTASKRKALEEERSIAPDSV